LERRKTLTNPLLEDLALVEVAMEENATILKKQKTAWINEIIAASIGSLCSLVAILTAEAIFWCVCGAAWSMWLLQNLIFYRLQTKFEKNSEMIRILLDEE